MRTRGKKSGGLAIFVAIAAAGCGGSDLDGSEISVPYASLSGGLLFATSAIVETNGYDLYWVPVPAEATTVAQPIIRLTHGDGNEWQPSVSRGGKGIVFAVEDNGIFLINTSGRISRISNVKDTGFKDSLPSISFDGARVAWVREDTTKPIGDSGFFETYVMLADFDGTDPRPASPRTNVIQDAPVFEPTENGSKLAWSEFNATTLGGAGPTDFGVYIHDFVNETGRYACQSPPVAIGDRPKPYRCFGQHLAWPFAEYIVTGQDLVEINLIQGTLSTIWPEVIIGVQQQQLGVPDIGERTFFPRFPISLSYSFFDNRLAFDGIVQAVDGDEPTLAIFIANIDGGGVWRLPIDGYFNDIDQAKTADYFFSVATPQFVP
jgi:hypothetical protein